MKLALRHLILHYHWCSLRQRALTSGTKLPSRQVEGEDPMEGEQTGWRWMVYCSADLELEAEGRGQ